MITKILTMTKLTDVILVCDDQLGYRAHKVVLGSSSPLFQKIFESNPASVVRLKGVKFRELQLVMRAIYLGSTCFDKTEEEEFIKVFKMLQIKGDFVFVDNESDEEENQPVTSVAPQEIIQDEFDQSEDFKNIDIIFPEDETTSKSTIQDQATVNTAASGSASAVISEDKKSLDDSILERLKNGIQCKDCGKMYTSEGGLRYHMIRWHKYTKGVGDQFCFDCKKMYTKGGFVYHMENIHKQYHGSLRCHHEGCNAFYSSYSKLKIHLGSAHRELVYSCDVSECSKMFRSQVSRDNHVKRVHNLVKGKRNRLIIAHQYISTMSSDMKTQDLILRNEHDEQNEKANKIRNIC